METKNLKAHVKLLPLLLVLTPIEVRLGACFGSYKNMNVVSAWSLEYNKHSYSSLWGMMVLDPFSIYGAAAGCQVQC